MRTIPPVLELPGFAQLSAGEGPGRIDRHRKTKAARERYKVASWLCAEITAKGKNETRGSAKRDVCIVSICRDQADRYSIQRI